MRGWGVARAGLLTAAIGLLGPRPALADPPKPIDWDALVAEGGAAPADAWPVPFGSASGSGVSAARPITGELETAWTFEVKGSLVDDPVVARDRIVIEGEAVDRQRMIHVVSLATGREMYRKAFGPGPRLRPVLVGDRVVLCAKENKLEGHQVGQQMLTKRWERPIGPAALAGALVHLGRVLVPGLGTVEVLNGQDGKLAGTLSFRGEGAWIGGLAARGSHVYALTGDAVGNLEVQELSLEGSASAPAFVGIRSAGAPESSWGGSALVVGPRDVFVLHRGGVETKGGASSNVTWLGKGQLGGLTVRSLLSFAARPTFAGEAWVTLLDDPKDGVELVRCKPSPKEGDVLYDLYAGPKSHPEWARRDGRLAATRDVVLAGLGAFRPESREVLREGIATASRRPIPVKDLLLVLEPPRTLRAYREKRGPPPPVELPLVVDPKLPVPLPLGLSHLVLEDGTVVEAAVAYDPIARVLLPVDAPKDKRTWPIDGVRTIVSRAAPARLAFARSLAGLRVDLAAITDAAGARGWVALTAEAASAGDATLAKAALAEAYRCEAPEADLARVEKAVLALLAKPRPRNAEVAARLEARAGGLRAGVAGLVRELSGTLPADASIHARTALWRAALARDAAEPSALEWVRGRMPKGLVLGEPFDAADALDLLESDAEAAVRVVVPPVKGQREAELTWSQKHLGAAMYHWRPDLVGIESGELLLLTPVSKPGRISHCLSLGRLVARTLEEMFSAGTVVRKDPWPLLHHLYESKAEYLRESTKRELWGEAARRGLANTAGHYDRNEGLTRVFVPDGDDGFEEIRQTYAHELTHHWMEARCPLYRELEVRDSVAAPGMWIVEGLADFVAGMRYDLAGRRVDTFAPGAEFLDAVANAERPIDWTWLYGASQSAAYALAPKGEIKVPLRRRLGQHLLMSPLNLFYAQSAATCAYLWHAEGGKHRKAFVEMVAARYTGTLERGGMSKRIGIDEATLGRNVVAWSRQVLDGKGP